ncbi:MAG: dinitrogenase iron-molybdenum cofactor [Thermodesulfobacterium geofontis]|uniref:Dinitrogenase iron-molybdenum cofactor n=1 Tax=Thermodesulfobacterium geofontis TaxID=1295609 RepID=A0A2N7QFJ0_9BACT|nr:MAG: dinitrogenase iron-molybdenum cofactor [Thermodesulfobacterium geofontis]
MRIAIAVEEGFVSSHFGRCSHFLIVDIDERGNIIKQELVENPGYTNHQPGLVPRFLQNMGVNCIIAGGMGPRAVMILESAGIQPILGVTGKVEDVLKAYLKGTLKGGESLCEHPHGHFCEHH